MKEKLVLKESRVPEVTDDLSSFFKLLEDMENKKEKTRTVSGERKGYFDSKAAYGYTVKIGIERNDFPFREGFHPRKRPIAHIRSIISDNEEEIDQKDKSKEKCL